MPGKHYNDQESRTWFYFPDTVTMSPMHLRHQNKSVSIKNICPWTISDALQAPSDYMETSPNQIIDLITFQLSVQHTDRVSMFKVIIFTEQQP